MKKKKILIISTYYFPYVGGAEIAIRETFKRIKDNFEIEIITTRLSLKNKKEESLDGIKIMRVGCGCFLDKLLFPITAFFKAKKRNYDLLFCLLTNQSALAGNLINLLRKEPSILNVQSGDNETYIKSKLGIFYFLYNWTFSKKYHYQVISNFLKKRCIKHGIGPEKITIIPNGFDDNIFTPNLNTKINEKLRKKLGMKNEKVLITVSRLALKNAVDDIIKSLTFLKTKNTKLIVIGSGEKEEALKKLTKNLKLSKQVLFLGQVDYKEIPKYLHISDVFIRPSLSEGFGNSFIEAMACGIPVIGTKVGGIPDFLDDKKTGLFVKRKNPPDIAEKTEMLFKNERLKKEIVKNGLKFVNEKYSWDIIAKQAKDFFDEVIKNEKV